MHHNSKYFLKKAEVQLRWKFLLGCSQTHLQWLPVFEGRKVSHHLPVHTYMQGVQMAFIPLNLQHVVTILTELQPSLGCYPEFLTSLLCQVTLPSSLTITYFAELLFTVHSLHWLLLTLFSLFFFFFFLKFYSAKHIIGGKTRNEARQIVDDGILVQTATTQG